MSNSIDVSLCTQRPIFFLLHFHLPHTGIPFAVNGILFAAHSVHVTLASHFRSKSIRQRERAFFLFFPFFFFFFESPPDLYRGFSSGSDPAGWPRIGSRRKKRQFLLRIPVALGFNPESRWSRHVEPDRAFSWLRASQRTLTCALVGDSLWGFSLLDVAFQRSAPTGQLSLATGKDISISIFNFRENPNFRFAMRIERKDENWKGDLDPGLASPLIRDRGEIRVENNWHMVILEVIKRFSHGYARGLDRDKGYVHIKSL